MKMSTISLTVVFFVASVPASFGNADSMSVALWNRIEALERRDKDYFVKMNNLEQQVQLSNTQLALLSAKNEDHQKDLDAKTKKLLEQDNIIKALKIEAESSKRKVEILEIKVQKLQARQETDKMLVQPKMILDKLTDTTAHLTGTEGKSDKTKYPYFPDASKGNAEQEGSSRLPYQDLAKPGNIESKLKLFQDNQELAEDAITDTKSEIAEKLLDNITKTSSVINSNRKLKSRHNERHANTRYLVNGVSEGPVAFHAVISKYLVEHIGIGQNIVFETVNLNLGEGYNNQHGIFIAPKSGLYIFSISILSYINSKAEFHVALMKNGNILAYAYGHGDSGRHDQGSVTVVTQLNVGDEISVKNLNITDDSFWGNKFTSFMGILVVEM